jgi:hypothetical protein
MDFPKRTKKIQKVRIFFIHRRAHAQIMPRSGGCPRRNTNPKRQRGDHQRISKETPTGLLADASGWYDTNGSACFFEVPHDLTFPVQ